MISQILKKMALSVNLRRIDELKLELEKAGPLSGVIQKEYWKKMRLEWNYNSNHIEGNTLTYSETELLLIRRKTTGDHDIREYEEMKAHDLAIKMIQEWAQEERGISEADIKNLNQIILKEPFWKEAITADGQPTRKLITIGNYKSDPNSVQLPNAEVFQYASPEETPQKMQELIKWFRSESKLHPAVKAAKLHYRFVRIHPFDDGNGRISRLLMNYVLMKNNFPPIVIKSADKKRYLDSLAQADSGIHEAFHDYILEQLIWSMELKLKAVKGESLEEEDDYIKEIEVLHKSLLSEKPNISPQLKYQVFKTVEAEVWRDLHLNLEHFVKLFSEAKVFNFINSYEEPKYGTKPIFPTFTKSTEPKTPKIFGHNIYEDLIDEVEWQMVFYSLKGLKEKLEFKLILKILFSLKEWEISSSLNGTKIISFLKNYDAKILGGEKKKLLEVTQKHFLQTIQEKMNSKTQ